MIVTAVAGTLFAGPIGAARAQEGAGLPDDLSELQVEKEAVYTHSLGNAAPPIATDEFPSQGLCLAAGLAGLAAICGEEAQQISAPVNDVLQENQPEDQPAVVPSFAQEGDLPVAVIGGGRRSESAVAFPTPEVAEGDQVEDFRVYFTQTDPSFTAESPAFRQAIVGALQLRDQDPSGIEKLSSTDLFDLEEFTGVEACIITTEFPEGAQDGNDAPDEASEADVPTLDCGPGANGVPIAVDDAIVWEFDLTLAARAWAEGTLKNEGVLFRPIAPENVAYGDPDPTASEQVTFAGGDADAGIAPKFTLETAPKPEPISFGDFGLGGADTQVQGAQTETFTEVIGQATQPATPTDRPAPEPEPQAAPQVQQAAPLGLSGDPVTEWWVWLLLPIFLMGAYLTSQALTAEPVVATERAGAMTRLIEARRAAHLDEL